MVQKKFFPKNLLSTTALTIAGLLTLSSPSQADNSWGNLAVEAGGFNTDISDPNVTNITLTTDTAIGVGNLNIAQEDTVNVFGNRFVGKSNTLDPTFIRGQINASGELIIIDANGVFFTDTSVINVGSILATTGNISNDQLFNNQFGDFDIEGATGAIQIDGQINVAEAGLAAFVAPTLVNNGVINAKLGKVAFAAGEKVTLDLYGDGLIEIEASDEVADAYIENKGEINAEGGVVQMTAMAAKETVDNVINLEGVVTVASAEVRGGKIILSGGKKGKVKVDGKLDASGTDGGDIDIKGQNIHIAESAEIKADGGQGSDLIGSGGDVRIFADNATVFDGEITAKGGDQGGNGGDIEVSALNSIIFRGKTDLRAPNGAVGTLLIDPTNVDIVAGTGANDAELADGIFDLVAAINSTTLGWDAIIAALSTGNVVITTAGGGSSDGNIRIEDSQTFTSANNLSFFAHDDIIQDIGIDVINTSTGDFTFLAGWNGDLGNPDFAQDAGEAARIRIRENARIETGGDVNFLAEDLFRVDQGALIFAENMNIVTDEYRVNTSGALPRFDITNAATIDRNTDGEISLGSAIGGVEISQSEIETIDAATLTIGGNSTTGLNIDGVDTTSSTISGLVTLNALGTGANVTIDGTNQFAALDITADNDLHVRNGASITTTTGGVSLTANNSDGNGLTVLQIEGTIDTTAAGADGDVNLTSTDYFIEIDPTGSITTDGGDLIATSNHGFDIDAGSTISLGNGNASIDAPDVRLAADINTDGNITGTATLVAVENDTAQIQDGVDIAGDGVNAVVNVAAGTFTESVTVDKSDLTLSGAQSGVAGNDAARGADETIVMPNSPGFLITANDVTLDGFTVDGTGNVGDNGIVVDGADSVTLQNNIIQNVTDTLAGRNASGFTTGAGIFVNNASNVTIANNLAEDNTDGVRVLDSNDVSISMNEINGSDDKGVIIKNDGTNNSVTNNNLDDNLQGVRLDNAADVDVEDNMITNSGDVGIHLSRDSDDAVIIRNTISGSGSNGILVQNSDGVRIGGGLEADNNDNMISGGNTGIRAENSDDVLIRFNAIENTVFSGVAILSGSDDANVSDNMMTTPGAAGVKLFDSEDGRVLRNTITGAGTIGVEANNALNANLSDNIIDGAAGNAIQLTGISDNARILRNDIDNAGNRGISADAAVGVNISDNMVDITTVEGIVIANGSNGATLFRNTVTDAGTDGIVIQDSDNVRVGAASIASANTVTGGLNGIVVLGGMVNQVTFNNVNNSGDNAIKAVGGSTLTVSNNVITSPVDEGIDLEGVSTATIALNNITGGTSDGIDVDLSSDITIDTNTIDGVSSEGIDADTVTNLVITGNIIDNTGGNGIEVEDSDEAQITGNRVGTAAIPGNIVGDGLLVDSSIDVNISGNTIWDTIDDAIDVQDGSDGAIIDDNTIMRAGEDGVDVDDSWDVEVTNNRITDTTENGVEVTNDSRRIHVDDNTITGSGENGVSIDDSRNSRVRDNTINTSQINAVLVNASQRTRVNDNIIDGTATGNGIQVDGSERARTNRNTIDNTANNGIEITDSDGATVTGNMVGTVAVANNINGHGIQINSSENVMLTMNTVWDTLNNTIDIQNGSHGTVIDNNTVTRTDNGINVENSQDVQVTMNNVTNTRIDGIRAVNAANIVINSTNVVTGSGRNGIAVFNTDGATVSGNTSNGNVGAGVFVDPSLNVTIDGNTLDGNRTGVEFFDVIDSTISNNIITNSTETGIRLENVANIVVNANDIENSTIQGLLVTNSNIIEEGPQDGPGEGLLQLLAVRRVGLVNGDNGLITLTDNTFTDNPIGARFENGEIDISDLTLPNTFLNTVVEGPVGMQFDEVGTPGNLTLTDLTLGNTEFTGYTAPGSFYIRFEDGAFLDPITTDPITVDALNVNFDGTIPAATGGLLDAGTLTTLESRLFDADDAPADGRGQIFVGLVPDEEVTLDVEDFFDQFNLFGAGPNGLSFSITGLPLVDPAAALNQIAPAGGGSNSPQSLAGIEPAAGGEEENEGEPSPQELASIEPGAGDDVTCWGDAVNAAGGGSTVSFDFGGTFEDSLAAAAGCSTGNF